MATKLHISGIAKSTSRKALTEHFSKFGDIESVEIINHHGIQKGLIAMTNAEEALKAITSCNGKEMNGRKISVNQAKPLLDR